MDETRLREIEAWVDAVDSEEGTIDPYARAANLSRACAHVLSLVAEVRRQRAALRWCMEEGGWRLFHYAQNAPPDGVFDTSELFNVRLVGDER